MAAIISGNTLGLKMTSLAVLGQPYGAQGAATNGRSGEFAYVNIANGNLVLRIQDEYLANRGPDGTVLRTYNSQGMFTDDNGDNWSEGIYRQPLRLQGGRNLAGSTITRTSDDGAQAVYLFDTASNLYRSSDGGGAYNTIRFESSSNEYLWVEGATGNYERYEGNAEAKLLSRSDANGNTNTLTYNGTLLTSIINASGESIFYDYTGNNLSHIRVVNQSNVTATRVHYKYDTDNRLSDVIVDLTPGDNLVEDGKTYSTRYTYDGSSRRVASVRQTDGSLLSIKYIAMPDGQYRVNSITDGLNNTTTFTYDTANNRTTVTDPLGNVTGFQYDTLGQLTEVRTGITASNSMGLSSYGYRYNDSGDVLSITDGLGGQVTFSYDKNGNQIKQVDALGNTITRSFNAKHQQVTETFYSVIDAGLAITHRNVFDASGKNLLRYQISAEGRVTEHRYDSFGNRLATIEYAQAVYDTSSLGITEIPSEATLQAWGAKQDLTLTLVKDYTYDFRGQLKTTTTYEAINADGTGAKPTTTQYVYSQAGELLKVVQPNAVSVFVYDGLGRAITSSTPSADSLSINTTITSYDDAGGRTTVTLANGLSTTSSFDAAGRLNSVIQTSPTSADLGTSRYSYDADNRLIMSQDPTGARHWMLYDGSSRKVADIDALGGLTEYVYTSANQVSQTIRYATAANIKLLVDDTGKPLSPALSVIRPVTGSAENQTFWNIYDAVGRLAWQIDGAGFVTQTIYDGASRILSVTKLANPINTSILGDGSQLLVQQETLIQRSSIGEGSSGVLLQSAHSTQGQGTEVSLVALVLGSKPAGSVTFFDGPNVLGAPVPVVDGKASLVTTVLSAGQHAITARYLDDSNSIGSVSNSVQQTILASTSLSLQSNADKVALGAPVDLVAKVSNAGVNNGLDGTVSFLDGGTLLGSADLIDGKASLSLVDLGIGTHAISAVYSGNSSNNISTSVANVRVEVLARSEVALTINPAVGGRSQVRTLTAAITSEPATKAKGSVNFYSGAKLLNSTPIQLVDGDASFDVSTLDSGSNLVTAAYVGDGTTISSTSATVVALALAEMPKATSQVIAPATAVSGAPFNVSVAITSSDLQKPISGGRVNLYDGDNEFQAPLIDGLASFNLSGLSPGEHVLHANYVSAVDGPTLISNSTTVSVKSIGAASSTLLTASGGNVVYGADVTLTAQISGKNPSGTVAFLQGDTVLGVGSVQNGSASITLNTLAAGINNIQASYSGDVNNPASESLQAVAIHVQPAIPAMRLASFNPVAVKGNSVAFTLEVKSPNTPSSPQGKVRFFEGDTELGAVEVLNGFAVLSTSALSVGTHNITAQYSGDANIAAATSDVFTQSIVANAPNVRLSASAISVTAGAPVTLTADFSGTSAPSSVKSSIGKAVVGLDRFVRSATNLAVLNGQSNTSNMPTGTVNFYDGQTWLGEVTLIKGIATLTTTGLNQPGTAKVTAVYSGDTSNPAATSSIGSIAVTPAVMASAAGSLTGAASSSTAVTENANKTVPVINLGYTILNQTDSGSKVSVSAWVDGAAPKGRVALYHQGEALGAPVELVNGIATFEVILPFGTPSLKAAYEGDFANQGATLTTAALVNRLPSAITLKTTSPKATLGSPVNLTANLAPTESTTVGINTVPTGTVSFFSGTAFLGAVDCVSDGAKGCTATLITSGLPLGLNNIRAVYSGDTQFLGARQSVGTSISIVNTVTATSLLVTEAQSVFGSETTLAARVTNPSDAGKVITGQVLFYNHNTLLGFASLVDGVARFKAGNLPIGITKLKAVFEGNADLPSSRSGIVNTTVLAGITSTELHVIPVAGSSGPFTLNAEVLGTDLSGKVSFYNGSTLLGEVAVHNISGKNTASLTGVVLPLGSNALKAVYGGDTNNLISTSASVYSVASLPHAGLSVNAAAAVTSGDFIAISVAGAADGSVTLLKGQAPVATALVVNGLALLASSKLPIGTHNLVASFSGNTQLAANSLQFTQTVQAAKAKTTLGLNAQKAASPGANSVQLSAAVVGATPTGTVTFYNRNTPLGAPITLNNGLASLTLANTVALDSLSASYSGDENNAASSASASFGAVIAQVVGNTADRAQTQIHDKDGLLRASIDGEGYITEYRYNAAAQQTQSIRYAHKVPGFTTQNSINTVLAQVRAGASLSLLLPAADVKDALAFTYYNARGQVVGQVDEQGFLTETLYDASGNLTKTLRYANLARTPVTANASLNTLRPSANAQDQVTSFQYNSANRLVSQTNPEGTVSQFTYDLMGNLIATTTALNTEDLRTLTSRYDVQSRLVGELSAEGSAVLEKLVNPTTAQVEQLWKDYGLTHRYDAAGRRISTTDQNANTTLYFYDANGHLTDTVNALGEVSEQRYNLLGQVSASVQYGNRLSVGALAALNTVGGGLVNNTVKATIAALADSANDSVTGFDYNVTATLAKRTDALGNTLRMDYNAFAQVTSTIQSIGNGQSLSNSTTYDRRGLQNKLVNDTDGIKASTTNQYDAFGRVIASTDANGNTTSFDYQDQGRTLVITEPQTLSGASPTQRRTTYDAFGRVVTQTEDLGRSNFTTTYAYDQTARSVVVTTPEGISVSTHRTRQGQTLSVTDGKQNTTIYQYDKNGSLIDTYVPLANIGTTFGPVTQVGSESVAHTKQVYDRAARLVDTIDANGHTVHLTYDAANRVATRTVDPSGLKLVTQYTYSAKGEQLSVTDPLGNVTAFTYNLKGELLTQVVDPKGLNLITKFEYDGRGKTLAAVDPAGNRSVYTYDKLGRRTSETQDPGGLNIVKKYSYDSNGNLVKVEIPQYATAPDRITRYAYDADNRLRFTLEDSFDGISGGNKVRVSENVYNTAGRLVQTIQYANTLTIANAQVSSTSSTPSTQVSGGTAPTSSQSGVTFGPAPAPAQTSQVTFGPAPAPAQTSQVTFGPAPAPAQTSQVTFGPAPAPTQTSQTTAGATVTPAQTGVVTNPALATASSVLTLEGTPSEAGISALIAAANLSSPATDRVEYRSYDKDGRLNGTAIERGDGTANIVVFSYDNNGNVIKRTAYAKPMSTRLSIDAQLVTLADPNRDITTHTVYDLNNRAIYSSDAQGAVIAQRYDALGNLVQRTVYARRIGENLAANPALPPISEKLTPAEIEQHLAAIADSTKDQRTTYTFDAANRVILSTNNAGQAFRYLYDANGNVLQVTQGSSGTQFGPAGSSDRVSRKVYDAANRLTRSVDPTGAVTDFTFDKSGNLVRSTQYANALLGYAEAIGGTKLVSIGALVPDADHDRITRYGYDHAGRQIAVISAESEVTLFTRNTLGLVLDQTQYLNKAGTALLSLLDAGKPLTQSDITVNQTASVQDRTTYQRYDGAGQLLFAQDAEGYLTRYRRDGIGQVIEQTRFTKLFSASQLNAVFALAVREDATNQVTSFTFDGAGQMVQSTDALAHTQAFSYDGAGHKTDFTNESGNTWKYVYDSAGRLISETAPEVNVLTLLGNDATALTSNESLMKPKYLVTQMQYDARGNLLSRTEAAGLAGQERTTTYTYDSLDRQINTTFAPVGVDNPHSAEQLKAANGKYQRQETQKTLTTSTQYNVYGDAISGTDAAGITRRKTYDKAGRIATETDAEGNTTEYQRAYAFGDVTRLIRHDKTNPALDRQLDTYYDRMGRVIAVQAEAVSGVFTNSLGQPETYRNMRPTTYNIYNAFGEVTVVGQAREVFNILPISYAIYDRKGNQVGTIDAMGYVTTQTFDANRNVLSRTEYATALTGWNGSVLNPTLADLLPFGFVTSKDDRTTTYTYDALNRKTRQTEASLAYTTVSKDGQLSLEAKGVTTLYGYDAVGNLTTTTDAQNKAVTESQYDALGRVSAVTVRQNREQAALPPDRIGFTDGDLVTGEVTTNFYRDAFGNVVVMLQRHDGQDKPIDLTLDRATYTRYDALGRAVQTTDALGHNSYMSYDALGRLTTQWQNLIDEEQTLFTATDYDKVGNPIHVYTAVGEDNAELVDTATTYNAFGEITSKIVSQNGDALVDLLNKVPNEYQRGEFYEYDKAGRVWRSNKGDGVTRLFFYDLQGNQTTRIEANGDTDLKLAKSPSEYIDVATTANPASYRRTDMSYDALGHLILTREPTREANQQQTVSIQSNQLYVAFLPGPAENRVDLMWSSLASLGSGDVRITVRYTAENHTMAAVTASVGSKIVVVPAEEAINGYRLKWTENSNGGEVNPKLSQIKVEKKSIFGTWATLYDESTNLGSPVTVQQTWGTGPLQAYILASPELAPAGVTVIPLYNYTNQFTGRHIITSDRGEPVDAANRDALLNHAVGWSAGNIIGYIAKEPVPGQNMLPLYRFRLGQTDQFRFSNSAIAEPGWTLERLDGYVLADNPLSIAIKLTEFQRPGEFYYSPLVVERDNLLVPRNNYYIIDEGQSLEVSLPSNLNFVPDLVVTNTASGQSYAFSSFSATGFKDAYRFNIKDLNLAPGNYSYGLFSTSSSQARALVGSGTFLVPDPDPSKTRPENSYFNPNSSVQYGPQRVGGQVHQVVSWDAPTANTITTIRYHRTDISDDWHTELVPQAMDVSGKVGVLVDNLPAGSYVYELHLSNWVTGDHTLNSGQITVTAPSGGVAVSTDITQLTAPRPGVQDLGITGYLYNAPAPGRLALVRYRNNETGRHYTTSQSADTVVSVLTSWNKMAEWGDIVNWLPATTPPAGEWDWVVVNRLNHTREGILGYIDQNQINTNQIPLYLLIPPTGTDGDWRLTTDINERNQFINLGWPYRIAGYVYPTPLVEGNTLWRVDITTSFHDEVLTANAQERTAILGNVPLFANPPGVPKLEGLSFGPGIIDGNNYTVLQSTQAPPPGARVVITVLSTDGQVIANDANVFSTASGRAVLSGGNVLCTPIGGFYPSGRSYVVMVQLIEASGAESRSYVKIDLPVNYSPNGSAPTVNHLVIPTKSSEPNRANSNATPNTSRQPTIARTVDRWGNVIKLEDPRIKDDGNHYFTEYAYNARNQLVTQTQHIEDKIVWSAEKKSERKAVTTISYDAQGHQVGVLDAENHSNTQRYDLFGNLVLQHQADGGNTRFEYNAFGDKILSIADKNTSETITTQYNYDLNGRLKSTVLKDRVASFSITGMNNNDSVVAAVEADSTKPEVMATANGIVYKSILAADAKETLIETVTYDDAGRKLTITNGNNDVTRYRYNRNGQVSARETLVDGKAAQAISYTYDALGHKTSQTDANHNSQKWVFDQFGRKKTYENQDGSSHYTVAYQYNQAGELIKEESDHAGLGKLSKHYAYDTAGQLISLRDNYLGQITRYSYDLAGNRLTEQLSQQTRLADGTYTSAVYQDNDMLYDSLNRLIFASDGRAQVSIQYDLVGNRTTVSTKVSNDVNQYSSAKSTDSTFTYDAMNRQVQQHDQYEDEFGKSHIQDRKYTYDYQGNRLTEVVGDSLTAANNANVIYTYDNLNRLVTSVDSTKPKVGSVAYIYDGAGRVVASKTYMPYQGKSDQLTDLYRYNQYDATGKILNTRTVQRGYLEDIAAGSAQGGKNYNARIQISTIDYSQNGGYDAAGNVQGYIDTTKTFNDLGVAQDSSTTAVSNKYQFQNGQYLLSSVTTVLPGSTVTAVNSYDVNGFLVQHIDQTNTSKNRSFINNSQGMALYINERAYAGNHLSNPFSGFEGGYTGNLNQPGIAQRQFIVNGQALARYGDVPTAPTTTTTTTTTTSNSLPQSTLDVALSAAPMGGSREPSVSNYTAQKDETLQSIARAVYGDARLWYQLADANGLVIGPQDTLAEGQSLAVPSLALSANSVDTFQPYDPSRVNGNLGPQLPDIPMPVPGRNNCEGIGQIIMIVVAAVVTYWTNGATANYFAGLGPTIGPIVTGAVAAAAGSVASQAVGNAIGAQKGFSWSQVAMAAIGGGVTAGLDGMSIKGLDTFGNSVTSAAIGNALTQGISVAVGLQDHFDWAAVATSALAAGVRSGIGPGESTGGFDKFARSAFTNLAAGAVSAVARGGRVDFERVAVDAFGNALGGAVVDYLWPQNSGRVQSEAPNRLSRSNGRQFGQLGSGTYGLDEDFNLIDSKGYEWMSGSVIQPVAPPSKGAVYLPTVDSTGVPVLNSESSPVKAPFQTISEGVYDFTETIRDGVRYRTWANYPANVSLRTEDGQYVFPNVYSTAGIAPTDAVDGSASYSQTQLVQRLRDMASNPLRSDLGEMRNLGAIVNPNNPWLRNPDIGRVFKESATFVGTGVVGMLTGGAFFAAARTGGYGLVTSSAAAGFYGDLTTQIANNGVSFATNGQYGQRGIDTEQAGWAGVIGGVPGVVLGAPNFARGVAKSFQNADLSGFTNSAVAKLLYPPQLRAMYIVEPGPRMATNNADEFVTFYHGTSPEAASQIRLNGIDLSRSKPLNDFGDGFYMTTSRGDAIESGGMVNLTQDVVEFRVPRTELNNLNGLKFDSPNQEWADFVSINKRLDVPYLPPKEWSPTTFDIATGPLYRGMRPNGTLRNWVERVDQTSIHTENAVNLFNQYMVK